MSEVVSCITSMRRWQKSSYALVVSCEFHCVSFPLPSSQQTMAFEQFHFGHVLRIWTHIILRKFEQSRLNSTFLRPLGLVTTVGWRLVKFQTNKAQDCCSHWPAMDKWSIATWSVMSWWWGLMRWRIFSREWWFGGYTQGSFIWNQAKHSIIRWKPLNLSRICDPSKMDPNLNDPLFVFVFTRFIQIDAESKDTSHPFDGQASPGSILSTVSRSINRFKTVNKSALVRKFCRFSNTANI